VLDHLPTDEVEDLAARIETVAGQEGDAPAAVDQQIDDTLRYFAFRQRLLAGALTAPQVAQLLGVSRQTPHDRVRAGTLLAVQDGGIWRFPAWQFDATAPDGVLPGLAEVIQALDGMPALSKISWFVAPKALLPRPPLEMVRSGRPDNLREVLLAAQSAVML
jgi:excisionase family DNA binding protein